MVRERRPWGRQELLRVMKAVCSNVGNVVTRGHQERFFIRRSMNPFPISPTFTSPGRANNASQKFAVPLNYIMVATQSGRPAQRPALPWEVTDIIIDCLSRDVVSLGACGSVCSEWLLRSRYHLFSTVQLWPWRVRQFVRLACTTECTFTNMVRRVEVDDLRRRPGRFRNGQDRSLSPVRWKEMNEEEENTRIMFAEAMTYSNLACFAQVTALEICNIDWTTLKLKERDSLRTKLSRFAHLHRLEFHDAIFHDMREVACIVNCFPKLHHLTANISFTKYLEHTISAGENTNAITNVDSIEVATDEGILVILSCIHHANNAPRVRAMNLKNIQQNHLRYVQRTLQGRSRTHLHDLSLQFNTEKVSALVSEDDLAAFLDFSALPALHTLYLGGLLISHGSQLIEHTLPVVLGRIDAAFLYSVELRFRVDSAPGNGQSEVCWRHLQSTLLGLHFFGMATVRIEVEVNGEAPLDEVKHWIRTGMSDLDARGVLVVSVGSAKGVEENLAAGDDEPFLADKSM